MDRLICHCQAALFSNSIKTKIGNGEKKLVKCSFVFLLRLQHHWWRFIQSQRLWRRRYFTSMAQKWSNGCLGNRATSPFQVCLVFDSFFFRGGFTEVISELDAKWSAARRRRHRADFDGSNTTHGIYRRWFLSVLPVRWREHECALNKLSLENATMR